MNQKVKYYGIIVGGLLLLVVASLLWQLGSKEEEMVFTTSQEQLDAEQVEELTSTNTEIVEVIPEETIYVYLCGAVVKEGVYEVATGTRLYEVIALAGGLLEDAVTESVNQAMLVEDGQQITIYTESTLEEKVQQEAQSGLVNINVASVAQLCELSGVGESRANDIIAYREANGAFRTNEDIMKVAGIKEGMYEQIKDYITVD